MDIPLICGGSAPDSDSDSALIVWHAVAQAAVALKALSPEYEGRNIGEADCTLPFHDNSTPLTIEAVLEWFSKEEKGARKTELVTKSAARAMAGTRRSRPKAISQLEQRRRPCQEVSIRWSRKNPSDGGRDMLLVSL